jgi:hypothetical protein
MGAPGYDVTFLGDRAERAPRHVGIAEGAAFFVDADGNALAGRDLSSLSPLGFKVPEDSGISSDGHALYWFLRGPELWRGAPGVPPAKVWAHPGDIDKGREDDLAFYALFIECRKCIPDTTSDIWRIPKAGGAAVQLVHVPRGSLVFDFVSDGTSLFVASFRDSRLVVERTPVLGGPAVEIAVQGGEMVGVDDRYLYETLSGGLARVPKTGGATEIIRSNHYFTDEVAHDGHDFFFFDGDELTTAPMGGGSLRLLASFGVPEGGSSARRCSFCGHSAAEVCVRCGDSAEMYRVPRQPRETARELADDVGEGLAVAGGTTFWAWGSDVWRRSLEPAQAADCEERRGGAPSLSSRPACATVLAKQAGRVVFASSLVADSGQLYFLADDGSVRRAKQDGGEVQTVAAVKRRPEGSSQPTSEVRPTRRSLVVDGDSVAWVDTARGEVLRAPRAGGTPTVVRSGFETPVAVLGSGSSLVVLSAGPSASGQGAEREWRFTEVAGKGTPIGSVRLPGGGSPFDAAMTREALYFTCPAGIARVPRRGGAPSMLLPDVGASSLVASEHTLYFSTPGRLMALAEGSAWPTVVVSGLDGAPEDLVMEGGALYFRVPLRFKWERWAPLGVVRLSP